jgi:hypothetical protein
MISNPSARQYCSGNVLKNSKAENLDEERKKDVDVTITGRTPASMKSPKRLAVRDRRQIA